MGAVAFFAGAVVASLAGCGSTSHQTTTATSVASAAPSAPSTTASPPTSAAPTTVALMTTVPNCGGGAYKPATLLIVCGVNTTTATNVTWSTWTASGAAGSGTVHLVKAGSSATAPGRLALSDVVTGPTGPQFTLLTVAWIGTSPDGNATDTFRLAEVP
jgi:hypothetical protein